MNVRIEIRNGKYVILSPEGVWLYSGFDTRTDAAAVAHALGWTVTP